MKKVYEKGCHYACIVTPRSEFCNLVYLCEIETEFENILNCLSGGQMDLNHEKKIKV